MMIYQFFLLTLSAEIDQMEVVFETEIPISYRSLWPNNNLPDRIVFRV